jgi:hypothetical protein
VVSEVDLCAWFVKKLNWTCSVVDREATDVSTLLIAIRSINYYNVAILYVTYCINFGFYIVIIWRRIHAILCIIAYFGYYVLFTINVWCCWRYFKNTYMYICSITVSYVLGFDTK